uniref:DUF342 domain-containing protein n=1 Tax=Acetatifactor sp. TaxID=1872090 RepID=UPI004055D7F5
MQNGYFQLVKTPTGYGVRLVPPVDGGEDIRIAELVHYLEEEHISYELGAIKKALEEKCEQVCFLAMGECPAVNEKYQLEVSSDYMSATARFFPPSETGHRITFNEVINDLRFRNIVTGIQMQVLQDHFMSTDFYCTDLVIAKGKETKHGADDRIEYMFNTDVHAQPEEREDGTVDYYNLNMINHCKKGDVLARIIRGGGGEAGVNLLGQKLPPREEKRAVLRFGNNIQLSEDRMMITSKVDGHVMLVDDDVFVSDVYEVENVDTSTGNIEYTGSVQVNGNVASNFVIKASGNVIINGVVEGAQIYAGGNIVIARGMNGMSKGILKAEGNVISKFIENATVEAGGYINTESILHSNVNAGTEITVTGKRGFITGGHVQAGSIITVKTLGSLMGASTIVEVGVDPQVKIAYAQLQKEVVELVKNIKEGQLVLTNFAEKRKKGARISEEQIKFVRATAVKMEQQKKDLEEKNTEMQKLLAQFELQGQAHVVVKGEVHPGTTIIIGDLSMVIQKRYDFCKFQIVHGDVKSVPL